MDRKTFEELTIKAPRPVVAEFWAPWCSPCKVLEPVLVKVSQEFNGRVDLVRVNADESPELLKWLNVLSIPTMIVYGKGDIMLRRTGIQPEKVIRDLFLAAEGKEIPQHGPVMFQRILRVVGSLVLAVIAWYSGQSILLYILAAIVLFSAVYDRCPIFRAIAGKFGWRV